MTNDILNQLDDGLEICEKPLSISAPGSLVQRYREVGELTKKVFGRNRVPKIARARIAIMLDEIEAATLQKMREKEDQPA